MTKSQILGLMLLSQQVIDGFDRIKSSERHFYKYGIPVRHGAVP